MTVNDEASANVLIENTQCDVLSCSPSFNFEGISRTDLTILSVIMHSINLNDSYPTATDIQQHLKNTNVQLRRTQLYERLGKLKKSGFVVVDAFEYPRRYRANETTLIIGIKNCIENKKQQTINNLSTLERELEALDFANPRDIAIKMKEDLSNSRF